MISCNFVKLSILEQCKFNDTICNSECACCSIEAASTKWSVIASWITFAHKRVYYRRRRSTTREETTTNSGMTLHMRGLEWAWNKPGADARRVVVPIVVAAPRAARTSTRSPPFSKSEGPTLTGCNAVFINTLGISCLRSFCERNATSEWATAERHYETHTGEVNAFRLQGKCNRSQRQRMSYFYRRRKKEERETRKKIF